MSLIVMCASGNAATTPANSPATLALSPGELGIHGAAHTRRSGRNGAFNGEVLRSVW
jgi:hypothetical protein